jgi:hypothetical protein
MRAALLCNGPSRVAFKNKEEYNYVMGCNIPWTDVDGTVMVDIGVARYYATHDQPDYELFLNEVCWNTLKGFKRSGVKLTSYLLAENKLGRIIENAKPFYSSGHMAALELIRIGATEIDIYGCDSYYEDTVESFTWSLLPSHSSEKHRAKQVIEWRKNWASIEGQNKVKLNFIKA